MSRVPDYYRSADLFVYTSLSETYGQVISEAGWCGLPSVALNDGMGVCSQIVDGRTGVLVPVDGPPAEVDARFAREALALLEHAGARRQMGDRAALSTRNRAAPERIVQSHYEAFGQARLHLEGSPSASVPAERRRRLRGWAALHTLIVALSYIRRRAVLNRNHSPQPNWGELAAGSELRAV